MSQDPNARLLLPQNPPGAQNVHTPTFSVAPQQYPQSAAQKNYVFVDEHNRHKRLKVMRACEGCRRRKIKCDAATTNTWPCSACVRLKLTCVRPNGYDGFADSGFETSIGPSDQMQQMQMQQSIMHQPTKAGPSVYTQPQGNYTDMSAYQPVTYEPEQSQTHGINYTTVSHVPVMDPTYQQSLYQPPQLQVSTRHEASPEAYTPDSLQQGDLADLLGSLKVDEKGTAPYLRNKASFVREEPAVEDDEEYQVDLPPASGPGSKIRIPPELMPEESVALSYIEAFFVHVHPYVPVLNKATFLHQWHTNRDSISPLILEAIFAMGGRLRDDPTDGHQWMALSSRHADAFLDVPRLSTLQGLLLLLKAREAVPKRGYYYRSWMTVVQCAQMGKDLELDEHLDDHASGRGCDFSPADCQLRTRIWQVVFVCEVMVGAPQGRFDLSIPEDTVDFEVHHSAVDGEGDRTSRNFTYLARVVRNVKRLSSVYMKVRKKKEWGIDPRVQQLKAGFDSFLAELPPDLAVSFPPDGSHPWIQDPFIGNLLSYFYLTLILYHRPQLYSIDPTANPAQWKHHMVICYDSAKALCRLQEATLAAGGLDALQSMQRGYSFTVYAGLSCIVLHLVAVVSPDPDLNADATQYFTRHMRIMEKVMEVWAMPELRQQVEAVREAFSADMRKPFVLKPSFPYGSPHPSNSSTSPNRPHGYRPEFGRTGSMDQHLDAQNAQNVSYIGHPISPPVSIGTTDSKGDSPAGQPLMMMSQSGPTPGLQSMPLAEQPAWNPNRIFEHWNTSFGTPAQPNASSAPQSRSLNLDTSGTAQISGIQEYQDPNAGTMSSSQQPISPQQYTAATIPNFVTPAMWQESVASVYEGGLKRAWDYDSGPMMKRRQ
ncbi:unnamed protein product [Clonostachys rosea]|uniref:Zn(2)-C6 fungal-type domain-containing protein n=1 Tax=Bionectria ochroleuca TaxID=29856 RepID=A0ABY6UWL2_BIOOC|nr:unnamed protein product [Clonostachys rosea]